MKRIILIIILFVIALISIAGIDEMKQRDAGLPPKEQSDAPGNGNGNGGGNGNNPNVPIDDGLPVLIIATLLYGVYKIKN